MSLKYIRDRTACRQNAGHESNTRATERRYRARSPGPGTRISAFGWMATRTLCGSIRRGNSGISAVRRKPMNQQDDQRAAFVAWRNSPHTASTRMTNRKLLEQRIMTEGWAEYIWNAAISHGRQQRGEPVKGLSDADILDLAIRHEHGGEAGAGEPRLHYFRDTEVIDLVRSALASYGNAVQPARNDDSCEHSEYVRPTDGVCVECGEIVAQPAASPLPERDSSRPAAQQGLFRKFDVRRTDGSDSPGGKHHGCRYFVLDVDHDRHARAALTAYAAACEATHPELARDLREKWGAQPAASAEPWRWRYEVDTIANNIGEALSGAIEQGIVDAITPYVDQLFALIRQDSSPVAAQPSVPHSLDLDPAGIRALAADAIRGALMLGAQGVNRPPEGHWLTEFWEAARAERETVDAKTQQQIVADLRIIDDPDAELVLTPRMAWLQMPPGTYPLCVALSGSSSTGGG